MKRIISLGLIILAISCSSDKSNTSVKTNKTSVPTKTVQTINITKEKIKVNWTAYKFTERAGVSGVFDKINIEDKLYGNSIKTILKDVKFEIPVDGINSNNPERDKKLVKYFFGTMNNTNSLQGKILSLDGNENKGTCKVALQMNDLSNPLSMEYHLVDNQYYVLKGIIDLNKWNGQKAVKTLNDVCKDLHIGKDGLSKLWPDIKVVIQLPFTK